MQFLSVDEFRAKNEIKILKLTPTASLNGF